MHQLKSNIICVALSQGLNPNPPWSLSDLGTPTPTLFPNCVQGNVCMLMPIDRKSYPKYMRLQRRLYGIQTDCLETTVRYSN